MTKQALIGHSGFVGSNLQQQTSFSSFYNSKNFRELANKSYDTVVCAGVSAVKWLANKEPEADKASIRALEEVLATVHAEQFILISTVDVYCNVSAVDERSQLQPAQNHAYGRHRAEFETFCRSNFPNCTIVRLPGLFGAGLKKNVIYDLLNSNCLEMINPASSFQYLDLSRLWALIQKAVQARLEVVNLVTEPVPTKEILATFFPSAVVGASATPTMKYDIRSCYAEQLGGTSGYILSRSAVLADLGRFIDQYQKDQQEDHACATVCHQ